MTSFRHARLMAAAGLIIGLFASLPSVAQEPVSADQQQLVDAYNKTGFDLYRQLKDKSENVIISPYSIGTAMAMALTGARGETEKEMARVLHQSLARDKMDAANGALYDNMNRLANGKDVELRTANALCLTKIPMVCQAYIDLISQKYQAELFGADGVGPINAWVAKKTEGKIKEILDELDPNSVCVLLNVIYFKGDWRSPFSEIGTKSGQFHVTSDTVISVRMMHQTSSFDLVEAEDSSALLLPYKEVPLAMIVLLPKEGIGISQIENRLSPQAVTSLFGDPRTYSGKVMVTLPKFKMDVKSDLIPPFETLGMHHAFDDADFGGISGQENTVGLNRISQIKHRAMLEVNERGSEAAAGTAVEIGVVSAPIVVESFCVDRPFLFFIVDNSTNAILFMGRVKNPLSSGG